MCLVSTAEPGTRGGTVSCCSYPTESSHRPQRQCVQDLTHCLRPHSWSFQPPLSQAGSRGDVSLPHPRQLLLHQVLPAADQFENSPVPFPHTSLRHLFLGPISGLPASSLVLHPTPLPWVLHIRAILHTYRASSVSWVLCHTTALNHLAAPCPPSTGLQAKLRLNKPSRRPGPAYFCRRLFQHLCHTSDTPCSLVILQSLWGLCLTSHLVLLLAPHLCLASPQVSA